MKEKHTEREREKQMERSEGFPLSKAISREKLPDGTYLHGLVIKCLSIDLQIEGIYPVGGTSYSPTQR